MIKAQATNLRQQRAKIIYQKLVKQCLYHEDIVFCFSDIDMSIIVFAQRKKKNIVGITKLVVATYFFLKS